MAQISFKVDFDAAAGADTFELKQPNTSASAAAVLTDPSGAISLDIQSGTGASYAAIETALNSATATTCTIKNIVVTGDSALEMITTPFLTASVLSGFSSPTAMSGDELAQLNYENNYLDHAELHGDLSTNVPSAVQGC